MTGIYIHAGAHRTGTSSFQLCLAQNRERIAAQGYDLAYPGRDGAPGGRLRMQLPRPRHGDKRIPEFGAKLREHLAGFRTGRRGLILSEENIPGPMRHFYEGRFFPAAGKRVQSLAHALDGPPEHLVYVLRSYREIYVSAYRKRAEDNAVPEFATLVPQFLNMDRGWPDLVREMRDLLGPKRMTVLPYGRRGGSLDLLGRLVPGLSVAQMQEPGRAVNLSATDAGLEALQQRYRAGETLARKEWQKIIKSHGRDKRDLGFARFDEAASEALEARYLHDLEQVSKLDGIRFL